MEITTRRIKVKDLIAEYFDDRDGGVKGYGGRLTIRPPYQREFVYDLAQQEAVINSILKGYPLGEMYWAKTPNGNFEIIDGQQRTVSICRFAVENAFSVREGENLRNCDDLAGRDDFMDYDLTVHVCEGDDDERLDWFKIINSHGEPLNDQELLNATYSGEFVSAARRKFKSGGSADKLRSKHLGGSALRQDLLRTALEWKSGADMAEGAASKRNTVATYMSTNRHDAKEADAAFAHYKAVINWAKGVFGNSPPAAKLVGKAWGRLYREYSGKDLDRDALQRRLKELSTNPNIQRKAGIYDYLLEGETADAERHLNLRTFPDDIKQAVYDQQEGKCAISGAALPIEDMEADHIKPWTKGGPTTIDNCQMVSRYRNRRKGAQ